MTKQEFAKQIVDKCIDKIDNSVYVRYAYTESEFRATKYHTYYPARPVDLDVLSLYKHKREFGNEEEENVTYFYVYAKVGILKRKETVDVILAKSVDEELIDLVLKTAQKKIIDLYT